MPLFRLTWDQALAWRMHHHHLDPPDGKPSTAVRLLPGFDQYVLGPGTSDQNVVPSAHRADVSRAAGWISPVVVCRGRVAGTWKADREIAVDLFEEPVPAAALASEIGRVQRLIP